MEIKRFKNYCLIKDICTEELLLCFISLLLLSPSFFVGEVGGGWRGEGGGWVGKQGRAMVFYLLVFFYFISKLFRFYYT